MGKGQLFSIDTLIALVLFSFVIISIVWLWGFSIEKVDTREQNSDLELVASNAAMSLFMTAGQPTAWHTFPSVDFTTRNISSVGLRAGHIIDVTKIRSLETFASANQSTVLRLLGLLGPGYNMSLEYFLYNGTTDEFNTEAEVIIGSEPEAAEQVVAEEYVGVDENNTLIRLRLEVWR